MNKIVEDILQQVKKRKITVEKILNVDDEIVIICSDNGKPLLDGMMIYKDGMLKDYNPSDHIGDLMRASQRPLYSKKGG